MSQASLSRFVLIRLALVVPILIGATMLVFALQQLIPGDITTTLLARGTSPTAEAALREKLGLDGSVLEQYLRWIGAAVHLDLGMSLSQSQPVFTLVWSAFLNTLLLAFSAAVLGSLVGLALGVLAAVRQFGRSDRAAMGTAAVLMSVPNYWFGSMLVAIFAIELGWFPTGGKEAVRGSEGVGDVVWHLTLPTIAAAAAPAGIIARSVRSSVLEVLHLDFVQALRSRGLSERTIVLRHVLRNAFPPIFSVVGLQAGYLLGGVIFVEVVFSWPGIGQLLFTSIWSATTR